MAVLLLCLTLLLSPNPAAAGASESEGALALVGGRLLTEAGGELVEDAVVLVRDGRIEALGVDLAIPGDARVIDVGGLILAPALVDAGHHSALSFAEHASMQGRPVNDGRDTLSAMVDGNRLGLAPERQAWRGLAPDGADLPAAREAGFGAVLLAPQPMILGGSASWILPSDLPAREVLLATDVAHFGSLHWRGAGRDYEGSAYPATLMGRMAHLRQILLDAQHRALMATRRDQGRSAARPAQDAGLLALQDVLEGRVPLVLEAREEEDLRLALGLADEFPGLRVIVAGAHEAWELADELVARQVGVLLELDFPEEPEAPDEAEAADEAAPADEAQAADDPAAADDGGVEGADAAHDQGRNKADDDEPAEPSAVAPEGADAGWPRPAPYADEVPRRLVTDRHARWVERVSGAARLIEAGVPVAFVSLSGDGAAVLKGVRTAMEHGDLTAQAALAALTTGPRRVLGDTAPEGVLRDGGAALITGWRGDPLDEDAEVELVLLEGRLFDLRTPAERRDAGREPEPSDEQDDEAPDDSDDDPDEGEDEEDARVAWTDADADEPGAGEDDPAGSDEDSDNAFASDDDTPGAATPYQVAIAAAQDAAGDTQWPVELDADRVPVTRTGGDVLLRGGHLLTVTDGTRRNTDLLVRDGRIEAMGRDLDLPEGVTEVDVTGQWIAPGVLDAHAHIAIRGGINEWTRNITPEVTIEDEVDPDDVGIYRALAGGTTSARLLHGSANAIGGRHEVIKLRWGASAPEMVLEGAPRGVKFALGENPRQANWGDGDRFPKTRMGVAASLRRAFQDARRYADAWARYAAAEADGLDPDPPRRDLRLEALVGIMSGEISVHSHCYRAHEILMLIAVAEEFGFKVATFQHVLEGYKVAREILAHGGLGASTFIDWWGFKFEAYDAIPYNPALVHEAGALMSINSDSDDHIRRLNLEAAKAVKYGGVPEQDALAMVTLTPATQLGLEQWVGSLEPGKDADLAVYSGHPFDTRSHVALTLVDGEVYFERDGTAYDAWEAELAARIAAGRTALGALGQEPLPGAPEPRPAERRNREVRADATEALANPRQGTAAPSTPTRPGPQAVALLGGTVHTMTRVDGALVEHAPGTVLMRDGLVVDVLPGTPPAAWLERDGYTVVDVSGQHVWPGMVDGGCSVGLGEISMVRQSMDVRESGGDQADMRASTGWHPASESIPVTRVNGITSALVVPSGGGIMGQSSHMALEGWSVADALVLDGAALHLGVPRVDRHADDELLRLDGERQVDHRCDELTGGPAPAHVHAAASGDEPGELLDDLDQAWEHLSAVFADAREYARAAAEARAAGSGLPAYDPRLEAVAPFALGQGKVMLHCDRADQIADALDFADREGLDAVIVGAREGWKVADRLALADVPVLVGPVLALPGGRSERYDSVYANAGIMARAGVRVGFRSADNHNARNLPYHAAMAVAFGLDEQLAMEALTAGTAQILGLGDQLGRLAAGLRADVIVTDGSPLQIRTQVTGVYIGGRDVGTDSKHTRLYETYRQHLLAPGLPSRR